jgi:DNA mismatch repair protein MutS
VRNYNITAKRQNGKLIFLRKIMPGATDESYGIEVAKLAGVPDAVIRAASVHLRELNTRGAAPAAVERGRDDQISLTDMGADALAARLRGVDPDSLTPREALALLYELRKTLD